MIKKQSGEPGLFLLIEVCLESRIWRKDPDGNVLKGMHNILANCFQW